MREGKIGVVGKGFVGTAIIEGFNDKLRVETYDKNKPSTCNSIADLCSKVRLLFVCVPTPMNRDGSCNIDTVETVLSEINDANSQNIAIIKSTVPPGTSFKLNQKYSNVDIVFSPEFLTEKNFINDFKTQSKVILGGEAEIVEEVANLFSKHYKEATIVKTDFSTSEMVKYFLNCFLALKVSFSNEIYQVCEAINVNYENVLEAVLLDKRVGQTHFNVPGPDGKRGFGGSCFPKDINAMISFFNSVDVDPKVLKAAWDKNLEIRPERDWKELKGRAVI